MNISTTYHSSFLCRILLEKLSELQEDNGDNICAAEASTMMETIKDDVDDDDDDDGICTGP